MRWSVPSDNTYSNARDSVRSAPGTGARLDVGRPRVDATSHRVVRTCNRLLRTPPEQGPPLYAERCLRGCYADCGCLPIGVALAPMARLHLDILLFGGYNIDSRSKSCILGSRPFVGRG